jgi:hypothetical protein
MRLSEYRKDYHLFTGKASDVARAAALGGIGLLWVFRVQSESTPFLPKPLLLPAAFLILGLGLDLLHYVVAALTWWGFYSYKERRLRDSNQDPELTHPPALKRPIEVLFVLKLIVIICGLTSLAVFAWGTLFR